MRFNDRSDAGGKLADRLAEYDLAGAVVLALPRGGVPVAAVVAERLNLPLDVVVVRKIGAPGQPELAVGAMTKRGAVQVVVNDDIAGHLGLSRADVERLGASEIPVIEKRQREYFGGRPPAEVRGRTAIVVDDGVATGATVRAALRLVRQEEPARLILALPVAPRETLRDLEAEADTVICLATPAPFLSVGSHFRDFSQTGDAEVIQALRQAAKRMEQAGDGPAEHG